MTSTASPTRRSAPRLIALPERIGALLGADPVAGQSTAYAVPDGLTVRNMVDVRGGVLDLGDLIEDAGR